MAIQEIAKSTISEISKRFETFQRQTDELVYEKCGRKFDFIESRIIQNIRNELSFIATPLPFNTPGHSEELSLRQQEVFAFLNDMKTASILAASSPLKTPSSSNHMRISSQSPISGQNKSHVFVERSPSSSNHMRLSSQSPLADQNKSNMFVEKPKMNDKPDSPLMQPVINLQLPKPAEDAFSPQAAEILSDNVQTPVTSITVIDLPEAMASTQASHVNIEKSGKTSVDETANNHSGKPLSEELENVW